MIEVFILSLIQGVTEFLPISSSSHLIIISDYFKFNNQSLSIDISLHIGSFFAVITYFRNELINFIKNKDLFIKILLSSIPTILVGFFLVKLNLIDLLRNVEVIGWATIVFGFLLFLSDKFGIKNNIESNFSVKSAIFIGCIQILSLIPGTSRSGVSITAARFLGFNRVDSAKISFLLSIPTLAAVTFFGLKTILVSGDIFFSLYNFVSILLSFIFSFLTIKYFLKYISKFNMNIFVFYRVIIGTMILTIYYL